jgi:hypothetical protein
MGRFTSLEEAQREWDAMTPEQKAQREADNRAAAEAKAREAGPYRTKLWELENSPECAKPTPYAQLFGSMSVLEKTLTSALPFNIDKMVFYTDGGVILHETRSRSMYLPRSDNFSRETESLLITEPKRANKNHADPAKRRDNFYTVGPRDYQYQDGMNLYVYVAPGEYEDLGEFRDEDTPTYTTYRRLLRLNIPASMRRDETMFYPYIVVDPSASETRKVEKPFAAECRAFRETLKEQGVIRDHGTEHLNVDKLLLMYDLVPRTDYKP